MIDFHTHILPGIDDGSRDPDESMGLLQEEIRQGVRTIVATPHFYANRISVEGFLRRREQSIQILNASVSRAGEIFDFRETTGARTALPEIYVGAEVYYFPGMGRAEKLRDLRIQTVEASEGVQGGSASTAPAGSGAPAGRGLILIEMPFDQWNSDILQELKDVLQKQKMQVVLAHVERYPEFQRDKRVWNQVLDLPLTLQINGGALIKGRAKRKFCLALLKERQNVILGSDCHNLTSRRPNLEEARAFITKKLGAGRLDLIDQTAERLLQEYIR